MVNASLNWASIVGIVLAVCGAGLYFMRSFKPALARDYDVFFAAIGLLCGGILFFQGWRLDPILQFGQFLLAGTTVFFAYESVRLRGIATDQARRSSYFDEEPSPTRMPSGGRGQAWDDSYDQFDEPRPLRRRFSSRDELDQDQRDEDFYRSRRSTRAAIPEEAESRRSRDDFSERDSWDENPQKTRRTERFARQKPPLSDFGQRRTERKDIRRGSRPLANQKTTGRIRNTNFDTNKVQSSQGRYSASERPGIPQGSPLRKKAEDAAFSPSKRSNTSKNRPSINQPESKQDDSELRTRRNVQRSSRPRDNSSRFDD